MCQQFNLDVLHDIHELFRDGAGSVSTGPLRPYGADASGSGYNILLCISYHALRFGIWSLP